MEADLRALDDKVGQLVELCKRLRADNHVLRQELAQAINDNKQLNEKVTAAKLRIETLLASLPEAE
jgi:cell division protein ZapB